MFVSRRMRIRRIKRRLGYSLGGLVFAIVALLTVLKVQAGIAVWTPPAIQMIVRTANGGTGGASCAVADNKVYCWGNLNTYGQLGTGDNTTLSYIPRQVSDPNGVLVGKKITGLALANTGTVCVVASNVPYCWGRGNYGALGDNTTSDRYYPSAVTTSGVLAGKTITNIGAGDAHVCVVASGAAYCWGANGNGRLGDGSTTQRNTPVAVNTSGVLSGKTVTNIVAGSGHTCAAASGAAYCWGDDTNGTLGNDSSYTGSTTAVAVDTSGVLSGKTISFVSGGSNDACALATDGTAYCWGGNSGGQLGNNSTTTSPVPVAVYTSGALSGKTLKTLTIGDYRSCAIDTNNDAYCWGLGPVGDGSGGTKLVPTAVTTTGVLNGMDMVQVAPSRSGNCFLNSQNRMYCTSNNGDGSLGNNTINNSAAPVQVLFTSTFNAPNYRFYANADSATPGSPLAGINSTTTLTSYGEAFRVRMGVKTSPQMGSIKSGSDFSCGLVDGDAYCWGYGSSGRLGNNSTTASSVPVAVDTSGVLSGKTIKSISTGYGHACVIASDDQAYCWGSNSYGQLGNNSTTASSVPVAVNTSGVLSGKTIKSISAGYAHTCVIASDNQAYCWGSNGYGQLGNNSISESHVPVAVYNSGALSGKMVLSIGTGQDYTCAIASDNNVYCWGTDFRGQLGDGDDYDKSVPTAVYTGGALSGKTIRSLSAGLSHVCAIASDNNAYCWGLNDYGQYGSGSVTSYSFPALPYASVPVAVSTSGVLSGKTILSIAAGNYHTCAIASDNLAYCWGYNSNGQLGNNSTTQSSSPVAVSTSGVLSGKTILYISPGESTIPHTCAIASDSQTYCWGYNSSGQLGNNSTTQSIVPVATSLDGHVPTADINPSDNTYKLQFAQKTVSTCSAQTGFADVTGSTAIAFNTNASVSNGASISATANDPVPTTDSVPQAYISSTGTFTNSNTITSGKTGLWDFSLKDNSSLYSTTYCLRMTYGDGTNIEGTVQYPELTTVAQIAAQQGSYRAYENADSTTPGTPIAATDTVAQLTSTGQAFRMRTGITPVSGDITATANLYKLQFAAKSAGTCSAQTTGFADVTGSTAIAFYTNASVSNGASISSTANDPVSAANSVMQTYISASGTFTNSNTITSGKTGLWDFSLKDNSGLYSTAYCLKIVYLDGTDLSGATAFPEVQTAMQKTDVASAPYRFYQNADSLTPGNTLGVTSQPLTLSSPNQAFRLRTGVLGTLSALKISTGSSHACMVASDNNAYCWGLNSNGQLGNNRLSYYSLAPTAVDTSGVLSGKTISSISAGAFYTCAIASDNNAYCWGQNDNGQLGDNSSGTDRLAPVAVNTSGVFSGKTILAISTATTHTCAIASDNLAYCWGDNTNGQLGNNSTTQSLVPVAVNTSGVLSGKTILAIKTGTSHTCVIASDNKAYCWGLNTYGQLGNNSTSQSLVPVAVDTSGVLSGKTVIALSTGNTHTCVIASDNNAYCWGHGANGRLGNSSSSDRLVPVAVTTSGVLSGKTITSITAGGSHTCAIASDSRLYCWGYNQNGYLGNNSSSDSSVPVAVDTSGVLLNKTITSVASKFFDTCALSSDGQAYCWGNNGSGQLGTGDTLAYLVPQRVASYLAGYKTGVPGKTSIAVAGGAYHTCAIASDNNAYCWGYDSNGQLGDGTTNNVNPTTISAVDTSGVLSGKTIRAISSALYHTCAIASDNQAYCWGMGLGGKLGNNSTTQSTVPVAVDTSGVFSGKTVLSIATGPGTNCAIASDNQAYCWGSNTYGQIGDGTSGTNYLVPSAVDTSGVLSGKTIKAISIGTTHTCAIASDNKAYCWGGNSNGQIGDGTTGTNRLVPVAVSTSGVLAGKTLVSISAGAYHTCVVDSNGAAYCWGTGGSGRLGNNSTSDSNVPVAVNTAGALSGKTILSISAGHYHTCAIASDNQAYCWGSNTNGQLGNNSTTQSTVPVAVNTPSYLSGKTILSISAGDSHNCELASDNQLYCWGYNIYSQLGEGSTTNSLVPMIGFTVSYTPIGASVSSSPNTYKLQYATKSASTCSAQTTGFADVTTSTPIAFNTNASATNGAAISTTANDPLGSSQTVAQTYISAPGTFTNSNTITYGTMGMWDFSLKDNGAPYGTSYCLRIAYGDGAGLPQNAALPEVKITSGTLSVGFVNSLGVGVASPTSIFGGVTAVTSSWQPSYGTLGSSSQKLRVYNDLATNGWSASIAATNGPTALWDRSDHLAKYDFNEAAPYDGPDSDSLGGGLGVDPSVATVTSPTGCSTSGISLGSQTAFSEGTTDSISLFAANSTAAMGCAYDLSSVGLVQVIPASQATGTYTIDMTVTVVAL